jgi:hypothetical protein
MGFWKGFLIVCSSCGHRNRPHPSPREGIRLVLLGLFKTCRCCGKELNPGLSDRPLVRAVRAELQAQGLLPPA